MAATLALPPAAEVLERSRHRDAVVVGAGVFGAALLMVGVALIGAYTALRSGLEGPWPPEGVRKENYFGSMLLAASAMLLICGEWFVWAVKENVRRQAALAGATAVVLLLSMVNGAVYTATEAGYGASAHPYAVTFYAFMAWALLTQVIAIAATLVALARFGGRQISVAEPQLARAAALLIHTAAIAWVVVWGALYAASR